MEESVKKAISVDDVDAQSLQSSMLDDVFFILRKSIRLGRKSNGCKHHTTFYYVSTNINPRKKIETLIKEQ